MESPARLFKNQSRLAAFKRNANHMIVPFQSRVDYTKRPELCRLILTTFHRQRRDRNWRYRVFAEWSQYHIFVFL